MYINVCIPTFSVYILLDSNLWKCWSNEDRFINQQHLI